MNQPYFSFQWHLTDACDQRCKHCYIFSENNDKKIETMDWKQIQETLANIEDFCRTFNRRPYLYLTGGDPILHPDFWNLLELLHEKNIPFTILGNPFHLTKENLARMKSLGCRQYQLSLDGLEKTHDWFRKPGSFKCTLEKIPLINEAGIHSAVMNTVSGTNIDEIEDLVDEVVRTGASVFAFSRYCPTSSEKDVHIEPEEYRNFLIRMQKKFDEHQRNGCRTWFSKKDHLWTLHDFETGRFQIPENAEEGMIYGGCSCGSSHLTILPDGEVYACRRVPESRIGSVYNDRLADLWLHEMEAYREFSDFEKCGKCGLLAFCRGCPAVAKSVHGSFYAADPQCWKKIED